MAWSGSAPVIVGLDAHFDTVSELHTLDDLSQMIESPNLAPALLGAQPQFVNHHQQGVPAHIFLGLVGPVTNSWQKLIQSGSSSVCAPDARPENGGFTVSSDI